ncbi:protein NO VEIN [Curcuma longa]|uniref:protein NO VEIN n=1 Tax=Curcuma longa TaxID=136217 RepID=UPI003D9F4667
MSQRRPPQYVLPSGAGGVQRYPLHSTRNPNFNGFGNPQNQGYLPSFPPNPFQNPIFAQVPLPYLQNPAFAQPNPPADLNTLIQIVDAAATKAHRELVAAGQSVSTWKVLQATLLALNIESWSSLGFQIQDVPSLHNLIITEGKINAFIHCFLGARRITSLYDLEVAICKNEGVERFEELSLGPLLHHPLIEHYFSVPPDVTEIFKITTEEIICLLQTVMKKSKHILVEKFLECLEEKMLVSKEKLCVRIQNLGLHINYIRGAMKDEKEAINQVCASIKQNTTQARMDSSQSQNITTQSRMDSAQSQNILSEKKILDGRFDLIAKRINTFASECEDFTGKHIRFNSPDSDAASDDEIDDDEDSKNDSGLMCKTQTFYSRDNGKHVSTCPYPSTTEEMVRLGLKVDSTDKLTPESTTSMKSRSNKSHGKKRKAEEEKGNSSCKLQKNDIIRLRIQKLNSIEFEKFITTWKEACCEHSLAEVLDMMVNFYAPYSKKKIKKILSSYPAIGLIGIAIMSIKHGTVDSIYDTFQAFGQSELSNPSCAFSTEMINVGPTNKENARLNVSESFDSVTVDDIVKKIADYMELETINGSKRDLHTGNLLWSLKKLGDCERWLLTHFSAKEFSTIGYGNFLEFLERYASLLPRELFENFDEGSSGPCSMYASLCEQQLSGLISLANYNWMEDGVRTKNDVFSLLSKQFPTANFNVLGSDFGNCISNLKTCQKDNDGPGCVLFSAALLGKQWTSLECPEKYSSRATTSIDQQNCALVTSAFENVTDCMLAAPMLSDLLSWSHWDLVYAPSFGPLIEWLLNEARTTELLCVATKDGKVIKVDASATVDKFLEDLIQLSPSRAALSLLSIISLYRGTCHAPVSLLKCYAQRAMEVVIRNFIDSSEMEITKENPIDACSLQDLSTSVEDFNMGPCSGDFLATSQSRQDGMLSQHISKVNNAFAVLARFILDCLGLLPPEFWSFAADILFSGLQFFTRHAPLIILNQCNQSGQRFMLHDIGLTLRVAEWVQDYHDFNSSAAMDRRISRPDSNSLGSESVIDRRHLPELAVNPSINNNVANLSINSDVIFPDKGSESFTGGKEDCDKLHHGFHKKLKGELSMEIASPVVNEESSMSNYEQIRESTLVIEEIRREEFGLDQNLTDNENFLLKKQHARLGRALHCLSQELYSQDSHLLLELVQNADDNVYSHSVEPTLVFILQEAGIVVLNNEVGFSADNIRALCDIGNSTKKGEAAGYIGHKGIGFKSVFRVTDAPEIHSNGFHVKFDITEGQIGFVLPTIVSPCDIAMFGQMLYEGDPQVGCTSWNTCIILPFRSKEATMNSIISMFSDLHPSLLLFLHRLRCIRFKNVLNNTSLVMRRETMGNGIVKVSHRNETMSWLVVNKRLQANVIRYGVQSTEIAVAFTLQESEPGEYTPFLVQQPVFAFLPLRNYGLKFIIQGDFILPSSREEVDGDSAWNQWLLSEFPALFVDAERSFCSLPCYNENLGKAVTVYMSFVPLIGEVHGFFSHLPYMIISKLRMSNCLLLDSNSFDWVLPCRTLRGWDELARITLPDSLLQKHLGFGYLNKDIILSDTLAKALGVQDYGPKVLIDFISSLCRSRDGINLMGLDWLSSWFIVLHSTLSSPSIHSTANSHMESNLINTLRKLPVIPLSDGSYGSISDGSIWLPCDISSVGFEGKQYQSYFPRLYGKLRIVNPLLFSATMITNCLEEKKVGYLIQMLERIGVQQLSAHEVIKSHILVAFSDKNKNREVEDRSWMIEYLSFIMVHFQFSCSSCHLEKEDIITELRTRSLLLTNDGYRCPAREPIHFSKEYGNPVDIGKLIGTLDLQWLEVDAAYLKHPSTHLLPSVPKVWREFLKELGTTDFVQVNCTKKHGTDILLSAGTVLDKEHLIETSFISDWESAELDHMLATFSFNKCRDKCIYLLEILDKMWDNCYSEKAKSFLFSETTGHKRPIRSTFMNNICKIGWIASSLDCELHEAKDLFYDCEDVRSVLGDMAPYAVPQLASNFFLKEIGFKTQVSHDDAFRILTNWRMSKSSFCASVSQMSKFYSFISEGVAASRMNMTKEFISSHFIFVPFLDTYGSPDGTFGTFVSSKDVFWYDPTGCFDKIREVQCGQRVEVDSFPCQGLSSVYPGLHDFFVQVCNVPEVPPFGTYLQLLQLLSSVALPSQAAQAVFHVFLKWCNDIKSGLVNSEEIINLKNNLHKLESKVLPTMLDKWVSLHPSFGIICWADDDNLKQQFIHSKGIDFLQFGQLDHEEKEMLSGKVAVLLKKLGVPSISELVSQEAIFYGTGDSRGMMFLINRILRYAQRYIHKLYPDIYLRLKQTGFEKLHQLQVVVVEKLFYKHTLKGCDATSNKRVECSCLLQGNILYATNTSDSHSIFFELSRFFFDGSTDLHFANFLHMIVTMEESGSSIEQIEFFIINSQKVPSLPDEEPMWTLSCMTGELNVDSILPTPTPCLNVHQNASTSRRKPGIIPNWPPTDWKTAPRTKCSISLRHGFGSYVASERESNNSLGVTEQAEILSDCIEVEEDWVVEAGLPSENASSLQDSEIINKQLLLVDSSDPFSMINSGLESKNQLVDPSGPDLSFKYVSVFPETDNIHSQAPNDPIISMTGRVGEAIAYDYLTTKLGPNMVRWVNEQTETGLPYDMIVGEKEYIEVKTTRYANKNWFEITTREWQFAAEMGDSFNIAHVVLSDEKKPSITMFKNPLKLCQQHALQLAVFMSRQIRDTAVST